MPDPNYNDFIPAHKINLNLPQGQQHDLIKKLKLQQPGPDIRIQTIEDDQTFDVMNENAVNPSIQILTVSQYN